MAFLLTLGVQKVKHLDKTSLLGPLRAVLSRFYQLGAIFAIFVIFLRTLVDFLHNRICIFRGLYFSTLASTLGKVYSGLTSTYNTFSFTEILGGRT
jgi:hypothetical protein